MEADDEFDDFYKLHRFKPSMEDAVNYFLPRLLAGSPLPHGADRLIRHADVYACEPKDLAADYAPVPSAVSTGDRFFFTTCKHKSEKDTRIARGAGTGTWAVQRTENVYHEGAKGGELKHLSFKKGKASTGWVMEEYRCFLPEAVVAGGEKVLCKIHLAPNACAAARQESDAYKLRQEQAEPPMPEQEPVTGSTHVHKRQAPAAAADMSSCKKMRMAAPVPTPDEEEYEDCPVFLTHAAPVSLPAAFAEDTHVGMTPAPGEYENGPAWFAPETDGDMGRFSCTVEELLGIVQQQQEQTLPVEEAENNIEQLYFNEGIEQFDIDQLAAPLDLGSLDLESFWADYYEEEAELQRRYNYNAGAADLQAPSLQGHASQFFSFASAVN